MSGQREHGTRACYVWGPEPGQGQGCRCEPCTAANRAANNHREREIVYGRWQPFVDAEPARQHVKELRGAGLGVRTIARLADLSLTVVRNLLFGRQGRPPTQRLRPQTAQAILGVRAGPGTLAPSALVDATGTRRRLQALIAMGWSQAALARRLGMSGANFGAMLQRDQVLASTARAVQRLCGELWDQQPATVTSGQKASATGARNYARARGWPPLLAWDDDSIDDPEAAPAEDWRRPKRLTSAETAAEALELITSQGYTRQHAAERLGVSVGAIDKAFARADRATPPASTEEDSSMPMFDPVARPASEYQRGAAFGAATFYRQHDAGLPIERIQETQEAAKLTLLAAARTDGEREFCDGYTAAVDTRLATLRDAQRAKHEIEQWEQDAEQEREAG